MQEVRELSLIESALVDELLLYCFQYLPVTTLAAVRCVCKQWNTVGNSQSLWLHACQDVFPGDSMMSMEDRVIREFHGNWKTMYLDRPHLRFDGLYVSRNTYIRTGIQEWRVKNPVHVVCYYRFLRFKQDGTIYYRTSPYTLSQVFKSMLYPSKSDLNGKKDQKVFVGRYKIQNRTVFTAVQYPNSVSTEVRSKLFLRSTVRGAFNRLDIQSIVSYDHEDGRVMSMLPEEAPGNETPDGPNKKEYRRGTEPYVFVPWERVTTSILNLPVSEMDVFIPG